MFASNPPDVAMVMRRARGPEVSGPIVSTQITLAALVSATVARWHRFPLFGRFLVATLGVLLDFHFLTLLKLS